MRPEFDPSRGLSVDIALSARLPGEPKHGGAIRHFDGGHSDTTGQAGSWRRRYQFTAYYDLRSDESLGTVCPDRPGKTGRRARKPNGRSPTRTRPNGRYATAGANFHDASDSNADAVIWISSRSCNDRRRNSTSVQSAQVKTRLPSVASSQDDVSTIEITTKTSTRSFPTRCSGSWSRALRNTKGARIGTSSQPAIRHRAVQIDNTRARELAELSRPRITGTKKRIPKVDKLMMIPMRKRDANQRDCWGASRSDRKPRPRFAVPQLKAEGMRIVDKTPRMFFIGNYHLSVLPGSALAESGCGKALSRDRSRGRWSDAERPRQAANGAGRSIEPRFGKPTLRA